MVTDINIESFIEKILKHSFNINIMLYEDKVEYHQKRAIAKCKVRKNCKEIREKFVLHLENDIRRLQPQTYRIIGKLVSEMKDNVKINVILHETWLKYFQGLWSQITQPLKVTYSLNNMMESITMGELMTVLKSLKSSK
jgi:hypothetical protein